MRLIFLMMMVFISTHASFAGTNKITPPNLTVNVDVNQQLNDNEKSTSRIQLKNTVSMMTKNHGWVIVGRQQSRSSKLFLILGKIEKADSETAKLKFLVLDLDKKFEVISEPELVVSYGKQGELTISDDKLRLQLSVMVNKETA